jgi:hypothetical protein
MDMWLLTIVICVALWIVGTIGIVFAARWLVTHEPH